MRIGPTRGYASGQFVGFAKQPFAAAPELSAPGEAGRHHDWPLYPRSSVQARPPQLKFVQTRLGRIIRDIRRKIDAALEARFGLLLDPAQRVRTHDQHQRGSLEHSVFASDMFDFLMDLVSSFQWKVLPKSFDSQTIS